MRYIFVNNWYFCKKMMHTSVPFLVTFPGFKYKLQRGCLWCSKYVAGVLRSSVIMLRQNYMYCQVAFQDAKVIWVSAEKSSECSQHDHYCLACECLRPFISFPLIKLLLLCTFLSIVMHMQLHYVGHKQPVADLDLELGGAIFGV